MDYVTIASKASHLPELNCDVPDPRVHRLVNWAVCALALLAVTAIGWNVHAAKADAGYGGMFSYQGAYNPTPGYGGVAGSNGVYNAIANFVRQLTVPGSFITPADRNVMAAGGRLDAKTAASVAARAKQLGLTAVNRDKMGNTTYQNLGQPTTAGYK